MEFPIVPLPKLFYSYPRKGYTPPEYIRIYLLTEADGTIRYVGKTEQSLENRLKGHYSEIKENYERWKIRWFKKQLEEGNQPQIISLARVPFKEWEYWERYFIRFYKALGYRLTNLTNGGDYGGSIGPRSPQFRKKRSKCQKEWVKTKEFYSVMANLGIQNRGKVRSEKTRRFIRMGRTGVRHTEETRQLLSAKSSKPRNFSDEAKKKMSFGKEVSRKSQKVLQLTLDGYLVQIWESRSLAQKFFGSIDQCISGKMRTAYGFVWVRYEDIPSDLFEFLQKKYSYGARKVYAYTLDGIYSREYLFSTARNLYGVGVLESCELPTKSLAGFFWRQYKKDRINLNTELDLYKQGKFIVDTYFSVPSEWDNILQYYKQNNSLKGYPFKPASKDIPRHDVKSRRPGTPSLGVVVKDKAGNIIETFSGVKEAEKKYTWRVIEYLKKRRVHPELEFSYK